MQKVCLELNNNDKMIIELYEDIAPLTVKNFLELVDTGFYNGTIFHRVIKDFMCQGGGYYIKDNKYIDQKKTRPIKGEFTSNGFKNDLHHGLGVISMARTSDKNSATSQFFLCVANCDHLDNEYAGFGAIKDEESLKNLIKLNNYETAMVDYSLQNFPNTKLDNFTIKTITRI